jgi:DAK2 domain fusion protein YloV
MAVDLIACDGHLLKKLTGAGLAWLGANQDRVNHLNVFPVPDGDTGTNMFMTLRRAYEEIAAVEDGHVGNVSYALAQGALMGARGNSGVILSQWLRGFADALRGQESFNGILFAQACRSAVDLAYKGVVNPVEGTILTVTRQAMEAVQQKAQVERDLQNLFETKVEAANVALQHTPDLLPVLKAAGVVDSGGQGWTYIVEGMLRALRGDDIQPNGDQAVAVNTHNWQAALEPEDMEGYGYDVQFLMRGTGLNVAEVRGAIDSVGWSTLVVGDDALIKVHVHVHDPGKPLSYAVGLGTSLDDVVVENMQRQYHDYVTARQAREQEVAPPPPPTIPETGVAVIAVASGDGMQRLFRDLLAVHVIPGGQTMNPSTEDFLSVIRQLPHQNIILLPNNPNVVMAAQQAAALAEGKAITVIPSRTLPQGISAMLEYGNIQDASTAEEMIAVMRTAIQGVITGEVTTATRDTEMDGLLVRKGQWIGLVDDRLVITGEEILPVITGILEQVDIRQYELVTLYYGMDVTETQTEQLVERLGTVYPEQQFQAVDGGQPLYPYIISIE